MSISNLIVKSAYAIMTDGGGGGAGGGVEQGTIEVGSIVGIGNLGLEDAAINETTVGAQFGGFLSTIVTSLTVIGGLAFVIFFTLGGLKWLTAGGDKTKVQEAQQQMTQGVIGLVAMVAGLFVVGIVGGVLGIDILNPFSTLMKSVGVN